MFPGVCIAIPHRRDNGKQFSIHRSTLMEPRTLQFITEAAGKPLSEVRVTLYGRQGAELYRLGGCELIRSAYLTGSRELETTLSYSYFAELIDGFSPEGEAEDAVYRLATAVLRAAEEGAAPASLARYLEAWLLRLHGLFPPLDRCGACAASCSMASRR